MRSSEFFFSSLEFFFVEPPLPLLEAPCQSEKKYSMAVRYCGLISCENNCLSISDATVGSELNRNKGPRYLEVWNAYEKSRGENLRGENSREKEGRARKRLLL